MTHTYTQSSFLGSLFHFQVTLCVYVCVFKVACMCAADLKALCFHILIHYFQESGLELSQHRYDLVTISADTTHTHTYTHRHTGTGREHRVLPFGSPWGPPFLCTICHIFHVWERKEDRRSGRETERRAKERLLSQKSWFCKRPNMFRVILFLFLVHTLNFSLCVKCASTLWLHEGHNKCISSSLYRNRNLALEVRERKQKKCF